MEYTDTDIRYDILDDGRVKFTFLKTGLVVYMRWNVMTRIAKDIEEIERNKI